MRGLLFSVILSGLLAQLNATPFQNGGFEVGPSSPVNFCSACGAPYIGTFSAPFTGVTGWTVTAGSIDIIGLPGWTPSEGTRSIDLDGLGPATMMQTFDSTPGATYQVAFDLAANFYAGQATKTVLVTAPGFSQTYTFNSTGRTAVNMGWATHTFAFVAPGTSSFISFASQDVAGSAFGPALDNVTVQASATAVPEPSSLQFVVVAFVIAVAAKYLRSPDRTAAIKDS